MWRWLRRIGATLLALAIAFAAVVWIGSERVLRKSYADVPAIAPASVGDAKSGGHWAAILGCTDCHDPTLHGNIVDDESLLLGTLVAPNLTVKRKEYDDASLTRLIRFGIKRDGTGIELMPSQIFYHADDQTIADVIAFIRSAPESQRALPTSWNGPLTRWKLFTGDWTLVPEDIDRKAARLGDAPHAEEPARGRYIASVACGECHGLDQKGDPNAGGPPNLAIAKVYSLEEFTNLMRHGVAKDGREIKGMMRAAATRRFAAFTDEEIAVLKRFLDDRAP